jgi:urea transport system ATP-binding protein
MPIKGGQIIVDGTDITALPSHRRVAHGVGYVPQGRQIFGTMTVEENIKAGLRGRKDPVPEELYRFFPVLGEMKRRRGGNLSGGQQQQLAIARALAPRPKLLILDEPTEGVQPSIVEEIEAAIAALKGRMAILLVEQYYDFARSLADAYVVLDRGRVALRGAGRDMEVDGVSRFLSV